MRKAGLVIALAAALAFLAAAGCEKTPGHTVKPAPRESVVTSAAPGPDGKPAAEPAQAQKIPLAVPHRGTLNIPLPEGMEAKPSDPGVAGAASLRFEASEPQPYIIIVTVLGEPGMMPGFGSDSWFGEELERWKTGLPGPAAAAEAVPLEFDLENVRGMYLTLEDSSPEPGKYPYLLQGFFNVDGCIVSFQALHAVPRASAANRFLALLVGAEWEPESEPGPAPVS